MRRLTHPLDLETVAELLRERFASQDRDPAGLREVIDQLVIEARNQIPTEKSAAFDLSDAEGVDEILGAAAPRSRGTFGRQLLNVNERAAAEWLHALLRVRERLEFGVIERDEVDEVVSLARAWIAHAFADSVAEEEANRRKENAQKGGQAHAVSPEEKAAWQAYLDQLFREDPKRSHRKACDIAEAHFGKPSGTIRDHTKKRVPPAP